MSQAPIMPVATDAMIADTTHLSAEEFGAYHLILYATWRNNGTPLPDDDQRLARVCRLTPAKWRRVRAVLVEFFDISDGSWRQKRLEKEWFSVQKNVERSRNNGKRGGRPKSLKNNKTENLAGSSGVNLDHNLDESSPYPYPDTNVSSLRSDTTDEPSDPKDELFGSVLVWMKKFGRPETSCRSMLGRWLKTHPPPDVLAACRSAQANNPADPFSYITKVLNDGKAAETQSGDHEGLIARIRAIDQARAVR